MLYRPSFSIVTPTLNAAPFIAQCITSVRDQNYVAYEHLIVDGGSTDGTLQIAQECVGTKILKLPGKNQSQAINAGLRMSSGDVVAWLNADDYYMPGALDSVGERFALEPDMDVVFGDCDVVDQDCHLLWRQVPAVYDFDRLLRRGNYLAQPSVFVRKSLLERVGFLDETLEYGMDYDLWLRLRQARTEYLPRVLAAYRWHPRSKTARNQLGNWIELIRIVRRYGGGWTVPLMWSFGRMLVAVARQRVELVVGATKRSL